MKAVMVVMVVVVMVASRAYSHPADEAGVGNSQACLREGGICGLEAYCPEDKRMTPAGLCGDDPGVQCCQMVPLNIVNCRKRGGECMTGCNEALIEPIGECPANEVCCILV